MPKLLRFLPSEITLFVLNALDSYTPNERASLESFLETHIQVLMLAAKSKEDASTAISMFLAKKLDIEEGYTQGRLSLKMFTRFYGTLAHYYEVNGEKRKSIRCHAHILKRIQNKLSHCADCDYFSISVVYEETGDRKEAFKFRQLAYHNQSNLGPMSRTKLIMKLFSDYSVGNDVTKAEDFATEICDVTYPYLLGADKSEYSEEVYFAAIQFFQARNMQDHVVSLQEKMYEIEKKKDECSKSKMDCTECINRVSPFISRALRNKCSCYAGEKLTAKNSLFCSQCWAEFIYAWELL